MPVRPNVRSNMRTFICLLCVAAIMACIASYFAGYRSGIRQSRMEEDQRGLVTLTLGGYKAAEATNWAKVKSLLTMEMIGFTRDYERRFGVPTGTNGFVARFAEAKVFADQIEKQLVPMQSGVQSAIGSNLPVKAGE